MPHPRVLFVLQAYYNRAGTEQHTKDLARQLAPSFECAMLFPHEGQIHLRREASGETTFYEADDLPWPITPYHAPQTERAIRAALSEFEPQIIHIQHTFGWPLSVLDVLAEAKAKMVMSFHDYYSITPYFTMQGVKHPEETFTREYSLRFFQADITEYLTKRRTITARSFSHIHRFVVPSPYLAGVLGRIYPHNYEVIEHGIRPYPSPPSRYHHTPFRFGYVGSLLPQKGWTVLLEAFPAVRTKHPEVELHFFGGGQRYTGRPVDGITFHGPYEQEELPVVLSQISVGVIPSVFAETYCLVLSELWQAGVVALVSDIGALGERVTTNVNGVKVPPDDVAALREALLFFVENSAWKSWKLPAVRTLDEMTEDYRRLYRELLGAPAPATEGEG